MKSDLNIFLGASLVLIALGSLLSSAPMGDTAGKIGAGLAGVAIALVCGFIGGILAHNRLIYFTRGFLTGGLLWSGWIIARYVALSMGHK